MTRRASPPIAISPSSGGPPPPPPRPRPLPRSPAAPRAKNAPPPRLFGAAPPPCPPAPVAALLMYEGQTGPRLTLYWGPEFKSRHETGLRFARSDNGTSVYYWIDDECGYAIASSDLARNELLRVAFLAYGQLEK